ncbi:uncharacterized protein LOC131666991 [Phymastichus coffea]|uniref:uncharacterized protein LOC131666991 n=1 Tax=Phymastichus coffea TaxID=108790 RepID=UPI00273AD2DC|nr:uncharacterized protein LOC131666991 [Phymastichus coffea]
MAFDPFKHRTLDSLNPLTKMRLFVFFSILTVSAAQEAPPEVQTKLGKIVGSTMKSRSGKNILAFRNIRYAKAPVGEKRFLPPVPVDPWSDLYDATEDGFACPYYKAANTSEDCLVLNIFTTELPSPAEKQPLKKPVIVFIHPGGFHSSTGRSSWFGPQYLLDHDIVLVTFNYRIGALGFISTGDEYAPGNIGLKDQNLVLKFVRDHIEDFGGDPNSVTLTGQNAGACSVILHMMSPMSRGLFHRVIAMSGSPAMIEPLPGHQKHLAIKQAEILECPTEDMDKMFDCLRSKPAEDYGNSMANLQEWHMDPVLIWYPVVEPDIPGVEKFLTDQPIDLLKSGDYEQVPLVTGCVRDEMGSLNMEAIEAAKKGDDSIFIDLTENWSKIAPISFMYERGTDHSKTVSSELMSFYFNNEPITLNNSIGRANIYTDAITVYPVRRHASIIAKTSKHPVYLYMFTYEGPYSCYMWSDGKPYGVAHQDDLFYIFYTSTFPMIGKNDKEAHLVDRMTAIWANFARTSEPIPKDNALFSGVTWEKLSPDTYNYLDINSQLEMKKNFFADRMKFWETLYPTSIGSIDMNKVWLSLLFVLLNIIICIYGQKNPKVRTKLGEITGTIMKTRRGKDIYAFRSIRYAKAPVGERRFLPPEPVDSWNGTYDGTQEGPVCPMYSTKANVSEDCLVLNIYTTQLASHHKSVKKPVIVFIHFGGFKSGSGRSSILGPQYLLDKDIVLVTFNYRLGPLGFISTGDKYAPGNLGLKDQNLVLRFVKDHISVFGGDPNSVTLAGQSAGSRSVYLHMMSPMSKGLFHRAIALSGPAMTLEPYPRDQRHLAIKLGQLVNCTTENMKKMFDCLKTVPAELFGTIQNKFWDWRGDPVLIWYPVIEPEIPGVERFLTDQPNNLVKSGNFYQVPFITGVVRDEMGAFNIRSVEAAQKGDDSTFVELNNNWETIAPISFIYQRNTTKSKIVSRELKKFYFNDEPISLKNAIGRAYIYADAITLYPVRRIASLMASVSKQPIYFYFFNYEGPYSLYHWSDGKPYGVSHQDELFYIFYTAFFPMIKTTDKENEILERFTTIWTNFAKTSKPIPNNNSLFQDVTWETLNSNTFNYLEINNTLQMKENYFADRMQFWEKLYPA